MACTSLMIPPPEPERPPDMPINGVLDLQRRSLPLGEIRIGESDPGPRGGRTPKRRDTFLFTTPVEETAHAIAAHPRIGGTVAPWDRRKGYWAVDTPVSVIEVLVPPRGQAADSWMEMWDSGRCLRRCDGLTDTRSGKPCMCPQPEDRADPAQVAAAAAERKRLAALKPPQGCKPMTRINVQIPGLPGITGVWVLRSGSANAAVETADTAAVLAQAREMDVYLPALTLIHWRPGQDGHPYPVLTLRLRPSAEQVAQLPAGMDGMLAMLSSGDGRGPLALPAGTPAADPASLPPAQVEHVAAEHAAADVPAPEGTGEPVTGQAPGRAAKAKNIAARIPGTRTRDDVAALIAEAKQAGVLDYITEITSGGHTADEELRAALEARWYEHPERPGRQARPARTATPADDGVPLPPAPPDDGGLWEAS
jgi:hypothetical protein